MKRMKHIAIGTLLLLAVSGAAAQSLGDYARTIRKNKTTTSSPNRHYDNDNLPTGKAVSVVGPPSAGGANAGQAANASAPDPAAAATEERQKAADEWKEKLDQQKAKVDALNHELDLEQRELRLRAATTFTNPGAIVHDLQWEHGRSAAQQRRRGQAEGAGCRAPGTRRNAGAGTQGRDCSRGHG